MKILLVIPSLTYGGAERVMFDMANYWANKGHHVSLVTINPWINDFYVLDENVNRIRFNDSKPKPGVINKFSSNIKRIFYLRRIIKINKPDVVLSFIDVTNIITILAATNLSIKVVVSERIDPSVNPVLNKFWFHLRKILYKRADIVVAQTKRASSWLDKNCKIESFVIPNPVRKLTISNLKRKNVIIAIGRLDKQKGHEVLIKSFNYIHKKHPDWSLQIYGEGSEKQNLILLIEKLNLQSKVLLKGKTNDVEKVLSTAGIFVLSSRFEGFPNALLEAMSLGCPVVSTNCKSGPSEIIKNNHNGYLVNVNDELSMADTISFLIENPKKRAEIGKNASNINNMYGQDIIMAKWDELVLGL